MNKEYKDLMKIIGLSTLIGFTLVELGMALSTMGSGTYIYYWEPNPIIWLIEVIMAFFGVGVGLGVIYEIIGSSSGKRNQS